jgi:hypothetical protein
MTAFNDYKLGNYNFYIIYEKKRYSADYHISSRPFIIINRNNSLKNLTKYDKYFGQIIRDIDFSINLGKKEHCKIYLVKSRYGVGSRDQKNMILNHFYKSDFSDVICEFNLDYKQISNEKIQCGFSSFRFTKKQKIIDLTPVYNYLYVHFPHEIIQKIFDYIQTYIEFNFRIHNCVTNKDNFFISTPSIEFPNYLVHQFYK